MSNDWYIELQKEENQRYFSQLCHDFYKLATMRVMQNLREKFSIPPEDIPNFTLSIFARFLNEAIYTLGAQITANFSIFDIYTKEHLLNLLKVLNNESLDQLDRKDIDMNIQDQLNKFKKFIIDNGKDFHL